jgi:hypothetical protein
MMRVSTAIVAMFLWLGTGVYSQPWKPDSLVCHDGSFIIGTITAILPKDTIYIHTADSQNAIPVHNVKRLHLSLRSHHLIVRRPGRNRKVSIPKLLEQ